LYPSTDKESNKMGIHETWKDYANEQTIPKVHTFHMSLYKGKVQYKKLLETENSGC
jgi:hypothetical protein